MVKKINVQISPVRSFYNKVKGFSEIIGKLNEGASLESIEIFKRDGSI